MGELTGDSLVGTAFCSCSPYSSVSDEAGDCIDCPAGKCAVETGSDACIDCAAGTYVEASGSDAAGDCIDCAAGTYVQASGSDEAGDCIDCPAGKYVVEIGSDACIDCPAGKYTNPGSADANDCAMLFDSRSHQSRVLVGPFLPEGSAPHEIFLPAPPPRGPCISQSGFGLPAFHGGCPHQRHREPRRQVRRLCLGASLTMSLTDQPGESCEPLRKNKSV